MRERLLWIGLAGVAAATGLAVGLTHGPTRTVESVKVQKVETRALVTTFGRVDVADSKKNEVVVRTVIRTVPAPGCISGPSTERIEERIESADSKRTLTSDTASQMKFTAEVDKIEKSKLTERPEPRWAVGADGGLRFSDATVVVRGRFEIRALGPFWAGLWGDARSAGISGRVQW